MLLQNQDYVICERRQEEKLLNKREQSIRITKRYKVIEYSLSHMQYVDRLSQRQKCSGLVNACLLFVVNLKPSLKLISFYISISTFNHHSRCPQCLNRLQKAIKKRIT